MEDPVVVSGHAFGVKPGQIGEVVVLLQRDRPEQFKGAFDRVSHELKGGVYTGITGLLSGVEVSAICLKGPADIADCVAFLGMSKTKCHAIFLVGSVGGLGDAVGMGDFVLATEAVGHDAYSQFLARRKGVQQTGLFDNIVPGSGPVLDRIARVAASVVQSYGVKAHRGRIFTTPGVSLEDEAFLREIVRHDCIAIDMETAQFYAACRECGFEAAAVQWVTDLPMTRSFLHRQRDPKTAQADWELRHPIWLNMAGIVTAILRGFIEGEKGHAQAKR